MCVLCVKWQARLGSVGNNTCLNNNKQETKKKCGKKFCDYFYKCIIKSVNKEIVIIK